MNTLLKLSNISYTAELKKSLFGSRSKKEILKHISFEINESEFLAVVGPSGSGKSTLAKIISGIIIQTKGEIVYENIKPEEIQILFQNNFELLNPNRKIGDVLHESIKLAEKHERRLEISKEDVLNILEIPNSLFEKRGFQLSGGQRQKVALARILFQNPRLLILDEPFAAQDFDVVNKLKFMLSELIVKYNVSVLCISHLARHFHGFEGRIIFIENGKIEKIDRLSSVAQL